MNRGEQLVGELRLWVGTPVRWEASLKGVGCDCKGMIVGAARQLGWPEGDALEAGAAGYAGRIDEAALLAGLDRLLDRLPDTAELRAGDVLAFRYPARHRGSDGRRAATVQHLAVYAGSNGRMIHAFMSDPALVCEVPLDRFWRKRLAGAWRWRDCATHTEPGGARPSPQAA